MSRNLYLCSIIFLIACNNATTIKKEQAETVENHQEEKANSNHSPKLGLYHAYQNSGAGYGFQYKFELLQDGVYKMYDKTGNYEYNPEKKVIHFLTGGLKNFTGIFTHVDFHNETRKLMIVIDFHDNATVPDTLALSKKPAGYYQYAYYQEKE